MRQSLFALLTYAACSFASLGAGWDNLFETSTPVADQQAIALEGNHTYYASEGSIWRYNKITGSWTRLQGSSVYLAGNIGAIKAIVPKGNLLYVGGNFDVVGDATGAQIAANNVATFNISQQTWTRWGSASANGVNGEVRAIADGFFGRYVGGIFSLAGGTTAANNLARFNGSIWDGASGGVTYPASANIPNLPINDQVPLVNALLCRTIYDTTWGYIDRVYVGGHFARVGTSVVAQNIAAYHVAANPYQWWSSCGNLWQADRSNCVNRFYNRNRYVHSLAHVSASDTLYISGDFSAVNNTPGNFPTSDCQASADYIGLARISGAFMYANVGGSPGTVTTWGTIHPGAIPGRLAANGTTVFYDGHLASETWPFTNFLWKYQGSAWSPISSATENYSKYMAADNSQLVLSGLQHRRWTP